MEVLEFEEDSCVDFNDYKITYLRNGITYETIKMELTIERVIEKFNRMMRRYIEEIEIIAIKKI